MELQLQWVSSLIWYDHGQRHIHSRLAPTHSLTSCEVVVFDMKWLSSSDVVTLLNAHSRFGSGPPKKRWIGPYGHRRNKLIHAEIQDTCVGATIWVKESFLGVLIIFCAAPEKGVCISSVSAQGGGLIVKHESPWKGVRNIFNPTLLCSKSCNVLVGTRKCAPFTREYQWQRPSWLTPTSFVACMSWSHCLMRDESRIMF